MTSRGQPPSIVRVVATAPIYLDHHATTPLDPEVLEAMTPFLRDKFGNAGSTSHRYGWVAEEAVERAREQVAACIGATPSELVFTSGATEANNLALLGGVRGHGTSRVEKRLLDALAAAPELAPPRYAGIDWADVRARGADVVFTHRRDVVVSAPTEHKAVLEPIEALVAEGFRARWLEVDAHGRVGSDVLSRALAGDDVVLVSLMLANNEIGTLQPLAALAPQVRAAGALLHTDATQALGRVPVDVAALGVDLLSLSAHKLYGPKGVGALYVRRRSPRVTLAPLVHGGGQERGLRSGTLNVAGIVGLGAAAEKAARLVATEGPRLTALAERLWAGLVAGIPGVVRNGHPTERLPGNLHVTFPEVSGEALMTACRGLAMSSGSACTSVERKPSHVLRAIGLDDAAAHGSLRFGLGRGTTEAEIDAAIREVVERYHRLRAG